MSLIQINDHLWINPAKITHVVDSPKGTDAGTLLINVGPEPPVEIPYADYTVRLSIIQRLSRT